MTETPKCPYCGAEMMLIENKPNSAWYECLHCCANSPIEGTPEAAFTAALHRAEPENRVLTLEELAGMANKGDWELAWMECQNKKSEKFFLTQKCLGIAGEDGVWFVTPGKADDIFYAANSYNKTWRCWPRKPTPEQMATEKWEE